jgi:tetratricopeptide (TPR) repeat protein
MENSDIEWWLKKGIEDDDLVLFVGAGMSFRLTNSDGTRPFPLWKGLIRSIVKEIPRAKRNEHLEELEKPTPNFLKILDDYEKDDKQVREFLKSTLNDKIDWPRLKSPIHEKLFKLSSKIITTNYDCLFERSGLIHKGTDCFDKSDLKKVGYAKEYLFKVHGCIGCNANRVILFRKDYEALYNKDIYNEDNPGIRKLKDILYSKTILFLGVALDDPYINQILKYTNKESDGYAANNYLFHVEDKDMHDEGVHLIRRAHYEDLDPFIDKLLEIKYGIIEDLALKDSAPIHKAFVEEIEEDLFADLEQYKPYFKGRLEELKKFKPVFEDNRLICVHGLGGIGKTNFISKFLRDNQISGLVYADGRLSPNIETLILRAGFTDLFKTEKRVNISLYESFHKELEKNKKTILIENYQDLKETTFRGFIDYCKNRLVNARIVLVSRKEEQLDSARSKNFLLEGLDKESAYELAKEKIQEREPGMLDVIGEPNLHKLCKDLSYHPKAIEIAIPLIITKHNIGNIGMQLNKEEDGEMLTSLLLDIVFKDEGTSEMEKELLMRFSVFRTPLSYEVFDFIYPEITLTTVNRLVAKSIIERRGNQYKLHPLVRELMLKKIGKGEIYHLSAAKYYEHLYDCTLNNDYTLNIELIEERFYHFFEAQEYKNAVECLIQFFAVYDHVGSIAYVEENLRRIELTNFSGVEVSIVKAYLNIFYGDYKKAFSTLGSIISEKVIIKNPLIQKSVFSNYMDVLGRIGGTDTAIKVFERMQSLPHKHKETDVEILINMGEQHWLTGNVSKAKEYWTSAVKVSEESGRLPVIASAKSHLSKAFISQSKDDLKIAIKLCLESIDNFKTLSDFSSRAFTLIQLAMAYGRDGQMEKALSYIQEAEVFFNDSKDILGKSSALYTRGEMLWGAKKYYRSEEALKGCFNLALEKNIYRFVIESAMLLADIKLNFSLRSEALNYYIMAYSASAQVGNYRLKTIVEYLSAFKKVKPEEYKKGIKLFFKESPKKYHEHLNKKSLLDL